MPLAACPERAREGNPHRIPVLVEGHHVLLRYGIQRCVVQYVGAILGALILAAYGVVAALQPISEFGRVYAAYGGIFIALSLVWGIVVDGFRPDRWDLLGAAICVVGAFVMVAPPRG